MLENDLIDTYSTKKIIYDKGEWKVQKDTVTQKYNILLKTWKKIDVKTEILPISGWEPSLVKSIDTQLIFKRTATDTNTLLPLEAWFSQKIRIEAKKDNPHEFLNEFEGKIFLHDLNGMVTQVLSMMDERVKKIGEPRRLTDKELKELRKSGIQIYTQQPNGELIVNLNL